MADVERLQLIEGDDGIVYATLVDTMQGLIESVTVLDKVGYRWLRNEASGSWGGYIYQCPRFIRDGEDLYIVFRALLKGERKLVSEKMNYTDFVRNWHRTTNDDYFRIYGYSFPFNDLRDKPPPKFD